MSAKSDGEVAAEAEAILLRRELGIRERSFNLEQLVKEAGINVVYGPIPTGAEGLSLSYLDNEVILVDDECRSPGRIRFTLAHEFGHQILGHSSTPCFSRSIGGGSRDPSEREANIFAATLLMPPDLFGQDIAGIGSLQEISNLANLYSVSFTAAAIRFVELTNKSCALISMHPSGYSWTVKSSSAKRISVQVPIIYNLFSYPFSGKAQFKCARVPSTVWLPEVSPARPIRQESYEKSDGSCLILLSSLPVLQDPLPTPRRHVPPVFTGLQRLDRVLPGISAGRLTLLAGRGRVGKTALALCIARHQALRQGRDVSYYSLADGQAALANRLISPESGVPLESLRGRGLLPINERVKISKAEKSLGNSSLKFTCGKTSIQSMERSVQGLREGGRCQLLIVDPIDLIADEDLHREEPRDERIFSVIQKLADLASSLYLPTLAVISDFEFGPGRTAQAVTGEDVAYSDVSHLVESLIFLQQGRLLSPHTMAVSAQVLVNTSSQPEEIDLLFDCRTDDFVNEL